MKNLVALALFAMLLTVTGCTSPRNYPISGQECGLDDPVKELDVSDCSVPGGTGI